MNSAPLDLQENIRYRRRLLQLGNESASAREEIIIRCKRDPIWFINSFLYTFDPQNYPDNPERPLILWPHQVKAEKFVLDSIGHHGGLFPKSRRMGVTTLILAGFFWRWRFRPMQSFLLLSAKEDRVDKKDDPSSLFWKLDHYNDRLPTWLKIPMSRDTRSMLKFANPFNGSVINGESTNADADRGGVRTAVLADEVAAMPNADAVINAIGPLTESLYLVSTPKGAFGTFYKLYEKFRRECPERLMLLHWTMHERFSKGLYFTNDAPTGYIDPAWGGRKPRSIWYDKECLKLLGPSQIAQELDIAFNEAGGRYFEEELVAKLLHFCEPPRRCGEVTIDENEARWLEVPTGKLQLWTTLSRTNKPPPGRYIVGCDIALGTAGVLSSQSTLSVVDADTGEKVAQYCNNRIQPPQFARLAVGVCRFFYNAKLIWGCQGPGVTFGKEVTTSCNYHNVFYREDEESIVRGGQSKKTGYSEQGQSRQALFDTYQDALQTGRFINRSEAAVCELRQFIIDPTGTVVHSSIMQTEEAANVGKLHGDIVVADALAVRLLPERRVVRREPTINALDLCPKNSAGGRLREYQKEQEALERF